MREVFILRRPLSLGRRIGPRRGVSKLACIHGWERGSVFVPSDFLDLSSREAVDPSLHRFARKGTIRRLARGRLLDEWARDQFGYVAR